MATETQPAVMITKHVNAPRAQVFDAWIKPELRRQWWRATPQMTCTHCEIDARQGGQYRIGMLKPAGTGPDPQDGDAEYVVAGEFELIDPPNKLVFTWGWTHPPGGVTDSLVTVEFIERGTGTDVTVTHEKLPSDKSRDSHRGGWNGCLEQMGQWLEK